MESARRIPADDRVPYAFEHRVMARIRSLQPANGSRCLWNHPYWQLVAPYVLLMLLISALAYSQNRTGQNSDSLDLALENTLYAPVIQSADAW